MAGGSWPECRLADLCESVDYGYTASAVEAPVGPKFLRITDIVSGYLDWRSVPYCSIPADSTAQYRLHHGDVVIARTGATTGFSALISNPPDAVFASYLVRLRISKKANSRFIAFFLKTPAFWGYMRGVLGDKSAQPNASAKTMTQAKIRLPSLPEQEAIAHILGTLDDKIELNRCTNETLEAIAQAIFKSWFVGFDPVRAKMAGRRPFGMDAATAALFPDSFEDSPLGEIPKGWRIGTFGDVAIHARKGVQPSEIEASTPYIALEHMPKRCIALANWGAADGLESNKFEFKKGEILFGKLRSYFHKVGVAALDGVCSTDIVVVTPRTERWFGFVLGHVSSAAFVYYTDAGSTGTKMPRTSWGEMARYAVAIPPDTVAEAFTKQIRPAVDSIIASIHESRTLAAIRDALLPKMLSGQVRVKDAEKLLETTE